MIFILCAIIMLQAGILYRLWQQRRQAELLARNRLRYIEEWLDLLYLYNNDPVSFQVGSINSIFYFLHKAAEPFNCLEQDNLA